MSAAPKPVSVLVIDDERAIRQSLRILLARRGFAFFEAGTSAEGIASFREHRPEIVLCDMIMPGSQGVEAIAAIRDADADVAIIAMSGSIQGGADSFLDRARAAGADMCLEKPFDAELLLAALRTLADR